MNDRCALPLATLLLAGCMGDRTPPAAAPPPAAPAEAAPPPAAAAPERVVTGVVVFEPQVSFRPCDGGPIVTLVDSTGNRLRPMVGLSGSNDATGIFVIGRGGESPQRELVLRDVQYAVRPGPGEGCEAPAPEYTVALRGLDSAWTIQVRPGSIDYRNATGTETLRFGAATPTESGGVTTYAATSESGVPHTLRIVLTQGSCREPKSGAYGTMSATVTLDARELRGCAWRGRL